jgi:hypothetical protein
MQLLRALLAINSDLNPAILGAANERPIDSGEWLQVAPYGDYPHKYGTQHLTRKVAENLVADFNSFCSRCGRLFRGRPIFVGHPDVFPDKYPDKRRYGRIEALEAREDGLWCKPAWNAAGEENLREGYYLYPSPVWSFRQLAGGVIEPMELVSVGLTNSPNIGNVQPWAKNEADPVTAPGIPALLRKQQLSNNPLAALYGVQPGMTK